MGVLHEINSYLLTICMYVCWYMCLCMCIHIAYVLFIFGVFSAVPSGSGAFVMPSCPSVLILILCLDTKKILYLDRIGLFRKNGPLISGHFKQ